MSPSKLSPLRQQNQQLQESFGKTMSITASVRLLSSSVLMMMMLVTTTNGFTSPHQGSMTARRRQPPRSPRSQHLQTLQMVPPPPDAPAGSFFNPVPNDDDKNNDEENKKSENKKEDTSASAMDIDDQLVNLLRQRNQPSRASIPSTINGVPTAKASGKRFTNLLYSAGSSSCFGHALFKNVVVSYLLPIRCTFYALFLFQTDA